MCKQVPESLRVDSTRERARECARGRAKDITGHGVRDADVSVNSALLTTVTVGLSLVCC